MRNKSNKAVKILEWVDELSVGNPNFSSKKSKCRKELLSFLETNEYFGITALGSAVLDETTNISQDDAESICPNIELWLQSYGAGNDEKLELLQERLSVLYPATGQLLSRFLEKHKPDSGAAWKLADYLCWALRNEISDMSDSELDNLAAEMDKELPLNSARLFSDLLTYAMEKGLMRSSCTYSFNSRRELETPGSYGAPDFLKMAYIVFNEESWKKEHLLQKALESSADANLWLFVSLHFICGWRGTDIIRIPMPRLPSSAVEMKKQLLDGSLNTNSMINELEFRLRYAPLMPQKTEMHENIPELKLFVPESLREPIGIIYAVAASHHEVIKPGMGFLKRDGDRSHIISFFGHDFLEACGERSFSTRRANKSYLQGIEMVATTSSNRPKGYMLAALARSHKGGFGTLPGTTDIYLKDAKFSGYRPEFIAREMLERGVFSFIPSLLLEMYAPAEYTTLPIPVQTKAISEIGIKASGLEGLAKTVDTALVRARASVLEIMGHPEDIRGTVSDILQSIASGSAVGKQEGFLCLMTAAGFACADAERSCCIGCGYEIYTKTILQHLSKEYSRLLSRKNESDKAESDRCTQILKEAIMPAISEILMSIKRLYPDADMKSILEATEMGAVLC